MLIVSIISLRNQECIVLVGLKALNGLKIGESQISVRPTCTTDFNTNTSIFIRNITETTTINDFLPVLSKFGIVLSAYVGEITALNQPALLNQLF